MPFPNFNEEQRHNLDHVGPDGIMVPSLSLSDRRRDRIPYKHQSEHDN